MLVKLELATPRRADLSVYRKILRKEFEQDTCFYCGKKLKDTIHVDHFIPWSFIKDDKIWNFVLACASCNTKKNNRIPERGYLEKIELRNKRIQLIDNIIVWEEFISYNEKLFDRMWRYAKLGGFKDFSREEQITKVDL